MTLISMVHVHACLDELYTHRVAKCVDEFDLRQRESVVELDYSSVDHQQSYSLDGDTQLGRYDCSTSRTAATTFHPIFKT